MLKYLSFKEWLLNSELLIQEAGFNDPGSNWFFGSALLPSDAFDWQYAYAYPQNYLLLQARWKGDRKQGRKFINMDIDPILNQNFVSIKSNSMPGEGNWIHQPDSRPNTVIDHDSWIGIIGFGKKLDDIKKLFVSNDLIDKTEKLNYLFGKFIPKYSQEAEDEIWLK